MIISLYFLEGKSKQWLYSGTQQTCVCYHRLTAGPSDGFFSTALPQPCRAALLLSAEVSVGKKKFSLELQKDTLNKTISAHWTDHISDHVYWCHKTPNRKKMEICHQPHKCFNFRASEQYLMTCLVYKSSNFRNLNFHTVFSSEQEENPTSPC